jgi:hypothetical protein
MGAKMRLLALALAGAALVVAVASRHTALADLYDALVGAPALSEELDGYVEAARRCNAGKGEVIAELGAGRLTLAEAAQRFERLDAARYEARGLAPPPRGRAEAHRRVIDWARPRLPAGAVARLEQECVRLAVASRPKVP